MRNIRTYKPHLSLIFVTLKCPLKLSLENGQPFEAIFSLVSKFENLLAFSE